MAHFINKDALVAEIERRIKFQQTCIKTEYRLTGKVEEEIILEYKQLLSIIDTLEVKEVDLEKEATIFVQTKEFAECEGSPVLCLAKHFFELGLKAKQG